MIATSGRSIAEVEDGQNTQQNNLRKVREKTDKKRSAYPGSGRNDQICKVKCDE